MELSLAAVAILVLLDAAGAAVNVGNACKMLQ